MERFVVSNVRIVSKPGSVRVWLITLLMAATMAAVMAQGASASEGTAKADSDGYVPVHSVCYSGTGYLGYYSWYYDDYGTVTGAIYVDDCLLADYGAGPYDRQMVIDHEMGHALGLPHSSDPRSYMHSYYAITGT